MEGQTNKTIRSKLDEYAKEIVTESVFNRALKALLDLHTAVSPEHRDAITIYQEFIAETLDLLRIGYKEEQYVARILAIDKAFRKRMLVDPKNIHWDSKDIMLNLRSAYMIAPSVVSDFRPSKGWLDSAGVLKVAHTKTARASNASGSGDSKKEAKKPRTATTSSNFCNNYNKGGCSFRKCKYEHKCSSDTTGLTKSDGCGKATCCWSKCECNPALAT